MSTLTPRPRISMRNLAQPNSMATPTLPRIGGSDDIRVGDVVEVPGGMDGIARFVGEVQGRSGQFVGVELSKQWVSRGKNNGESEGVRYFTPSVPNSGIFLPIARAAKRNSPAMSSTGSTVHTPTTPSLDSYNTSSNNLANPYTPPTPSHAKTYNPPPNSKRAPSPAFRPKSRPSLPRPESPIRRTQNATPMGSRPSLGMNSSNRFGGTPRFAPSPTPGKMASRARQPTNLGSSFSEDSPTPTKTNGSKAAVRRPSISTTALDEEVAQLRKVLQEKTAEFDTHRADFRSTLDTLELASTETIRVYEAKIEDLTREIKELREQHLEVEEVAYQVQHMEGLVSEMEEDLEKALRGEAEARGEAEYLRGEVERLRAEASRREEGARERGASIGHDVGRNGSLKVGTTSGMNGGVARDEHPTDTLGKEVKKVGIEEKDNTEGVNAAKGEMVEDATKWCALCEGDGHDSISCPFEKA